MKSLNLITLTGCIFVKPFYDHFQNNYLSYIFIGQIPLLVILLRQNSQVSPLNFKCF